MAGKPNRADWGNVRQLASGRYQARFTKPDGKITSAGTYKTKKEARSALAQLQSQIDTNTYTDPNSGAALLDAFAEDHFVNGGYAVRTLALYRSQFKNYVSPHIGHLPLNKITAKRIDEWYNKDLLKGGKTRVATATVRRQVYTTLHGVFRQAEKYDYIARNPCRITGATTPKNSERPYMPIATFKKVRDAHPEHLRIVLDTMFHAHLRPGELIALKRSDLDTKSNTLTIERQGIDVKGGVEITKTKTQIVRHPVIPASLVKRLSEMLDARSDDAPWLFVRPNGQQHRRNALEDSWRKAANSVDLPKVNLYDVKHTSLTELAQRGTSVKQMMARGGHKTSAAALRYQHVDPTKDAQLAAALEDSLSD